MKKSSLFNKSRGRLGAFGFIILIGCEVLLADDIDFYLTPPPLPVSPNVLFILDESGSMADANRMTDLKAAMKILLKDSLMDDVNAAILGYTTNTGDTGPLRLLGHADFAKVRDDRSNMIADVDKLTPLSFTPTVKVLEAGMQWFDSGFTEIKGSSSTPYKTGSTFASPMSDSKYWCAPNHMVILTDGEPNSNSTTSNLKYGLSSYKGKSCVSDATSKNQNGRCAREIAEYGFTTDLRIDSGWDDIQNVITHAIAMGDSVGSDDKTFLRSISSAGGGNYYEADSATDLLDAFTEIVEQAIAQVAFSYSSPVIPVSADNASISSDYAYIPMFVPQPFDYWSGNLKRFKVTIDNEGIPVIDDSKDTWQAEPTSPAPLPAEKPLYGGAAGIIETTGGPRSIYTWLDGNSTDLTDPANRLSRDNFEDNGGLITNAMLQAEDCKVTWVPIKTCTKWKTKKGKKICQQWDTTYQEEKLCPGGDYLDWLNHQSASDEYPFMDMAAPLHTQPVEVGNMVYLATSQGLLHAFDKATGEEKWAYMPDELLPKIQKARVNAANNDIPEYGLDGSTVLVDLGGGTKYLVQSMRRGGRNIYALDITDPTTPKLAWEIKGGVTTGFDLLAQTWSRPQIGHLTKDGALLLSFGGGYDPDQDKVTGARQADDIGNVIYIINAKTGGKVKEIKNGWGGISGMNNGIAADIRWVDIDNDGDDDRIYAADVGGRLIRIDLEANEGGILADVNGGASAGDNRKFFVSPEISYMNLDKKFLAIAIGSGNRPDPLAHTLDVEERFYVIKDYDIFTPSDWSLQRTYTHTDSDFVDVTANKAQTGTGEERVTALAEIASKNGWYYVFPNSGEKTMSKALIFNYSVMFTTYSGTKTDVPEPCKAVPTTGTPRFYALDLRHGGARYVDLAKDEDGEMERSVILEHLQGLPPPPQLLIPPPELTGHSEVVVIVGVDVLLKWSNRLIGVSWEELLDATDD